MIVDVSGGFGSFEESVAVVGSLCTGGGHEESV